MSDNQKRVQIDFSFDKASARRLDELVTRLHADSRADLLRKALLVLDEGTRGQLDCRKITVLGHNNERIVIDLTTK